MFAGALTRVWMLHALTSCSWLWLICACYQLKRYFTEVLIDQLPILKDLKVGAATLPCFSRLAQTSSALRVRRKPWTAWCC